MKRLCKGRKGLIFLLVSAMLMLYTGCSSSVSEDRTEIAREGAGTRAMSGNTMSYDADTGYDPGSVVMEEGTEAAAEAQNDGKTAGFPEETQQLQSGRKLVRTVDMDIETKEFDTALSALESRAGELGGYIEEMNTYNGSSYSSHQETCRADLTVRIPVQQLEEFLDTVSDLCNVTRRSENTEDVTLAYTDLESRRNALETEQTRLLELLGQAGTIEDIIAIESRLSEVRYQLESMESRLRVYDNKIDYSTVYLNIIGVETLTPVSEEGTWERIAKGFTASLENIIAGLKEFLIGLAINLPYLIFAGVFTIALIFIIMKIVKRPAGKRAEQTEKKKEKAAKLTQDGQEGLRNGEKHE